VGATTGSARSTNRSRELLLEPHQLQHLPQTALVAVRGGRGSDSRDIRFTDVNPAIAALADVADVPLVAGAHP